MDHLCGCFIDPNFTRAANEHFAAAGANSLRDDLEGYREGDTVCLWDAELELFGKLLRKPSQVTGTCVGVNTGQAVADSIINAVAFGDQAMAGPPRELAWEAEWAESRTAPDIGNGRLRGDGTCVPWMAMAMHRGVSYRGKIAGFDLTHQDENLAQDWGRSGNRVPPAVLAAAGDGIAAAFNAKSRAAALGAIRSLRGGVRAGPWKLNPHADANGYSGWLPCGGHCESWRAVIEMPDGPKVAEQQLWTGDCPQGEITITDAHGRKITLPDGCRLIGMHEVDMAIEAGDVWFFAAPFDLPREA